MIKSLLVLLVLSLAVSTTTAFFPMIPHQSTTTTTTTTTTRLVATLDGSDDEATYFEDLELAVHAVTKFGALDPDELHKLADKVEAGADSCIFESSLEEATELEHDLCEKEIADRKDVAEVLRMQAELKLRMEAIEGSSLFVADVLEEANIRSRDLEMELLSEDGV